MIYSYKRGANPQLKYAKSVKFLNKKVLFKPGINLIVGPNGSGKSSLLDAMKTLFLSKQQGFTKLTGLQGLGSLKCDDKYGGNRSFSFSDSVTHDGGPVVCDVVYEKSFFDDDNFQESFASINAQKSLSAGQVVGWHLGRTIDRIKSSVDVESQVLSFKSECSDHWGKIADMWLEWFCSGIVKPLNDPSMCVLLDEPTKSFDLSSRSVFWNVIKDKFDSRQAIIATHDIEPFLFLEKFNIVETEDGYEDKIREFIDVVKSC